MGRKKPPLYYFESPLADQEAVFDEAFQKELQQLLEKEQTVRDPKELTLLVFKLMRSWYRLICKW